MNFTKFKVTSEDICNYDELLKLNLCKYFEYDYFESSPEQLNAMQAILKRESNIFVNNFLLWEAMIVYVYNYRL